MVCFDDKLLKRVMKRSKGDFQRNVEFFCFTIQDQQDNIRKTSHSSLITGLRKRLSCHFNKQNFVVTLMLKASAEVVNRPLDETRSVFILFLSIKQTRPRQRKVN